MQKPFLNSRVFNFENLAEEPIKIIDSAKIRWDDTLIFREAKINNEKLTVILYDYGEIIGVHQPISKMITEFAREVGLNNVITRANARVYNVGKCMPVTNGRFQMIPTCGVRNDDVMWFMKHRVLSAGADPKDGRLLIAFEENIQVKINLSEAVYNRRARQADEISSLQFGYLEYIKYRYGAEGYQHTGGRIPVEDRHLNEERRLLRTLGVDAAIDTLEKLAEKIFGQKLSDDEKKDFISMLEQPFHI